MPRKNANAVKRPKTPARQRVWKHNSFRGHTAMMQQQLRGMLASDSITEAARGQILTVQLEVQTLDGLLKERKDP